MYFDKKECSSGLSEADRSWNASDETSDILFLLHFSLEKSLPEEDGDKMLIVLDRLFRKAIEHGFEQGFNSGFTKGLYSKQVNPENNKQ